MGEDSAGGKEEKKRIETLRTAWFDRCKDILSGTPPERPPLRAVNHAIPLVDDNKIYNYYLPRCAEAFRAPFMEKMNRYIANGWWEPASVSQAAPLMCIPKNKRDSRLRTVIDSRKRNANTVRDVTPLPDQDQIRTDMAKARYRSKIDLSDAYEQIRVEPADVWKTAFATIAGTLVSHVMQMGDCNAPATFQRLMTHVFRQQIGIFVHVFFDDIFVFSNTIKEHEEHLGTVFKLLREFHLFINKEKCFLYAERIECLGHVIDQAGIHIGSDKMDRIRAWRTPRNVNEVQRFLGLVQYIAQFMPDLSAYTGPLAALCSETQTFHWRPLHDKCLEMIKVLACKMPILRPINLETGEPLWLVCDASVSGIGAMYGQGESW